jgi:CheY-like chemotaxis protein
LSGETNGHCELFVAVSDNGIGISDEQKEKLFSAFEQGDSGIARIYGGTGLGLVITKRIVELMGGNVWVESESGKGARFMFTANVRRGGRSSSDKESNKPETGSNSFDGKKLLVAEDVEINREILLALLEDTGLIIDCAENGKEAFEMIKAAPEKYDIVLMDVQMPQMDGLESSRRIRALPKHKREKLPIIAMTANVFKNDIEECLAAGMDDHIGKPLDIDNVFEKLRKYLL